MLTKDRLQELYNELLDKYPDGISNTSTKKFDPTREYLATELGISNNDIYICGSGTRAGNLEVRLSQGQRAKQHTVLGVTYLLDDVGTDENVSKLTSSAFTTAEKYVGASGKAEYDVILVVVIRDKELFVTGVMYLEHSKVAAKIMNAFPNIDSKPVSSIAGLSTPTDLIQKIFYGCPGTGKSRKVKGETEGIYGEKAVYFDKVTHKAIPTPEDKRERINTPSNVFRTTFHPDYDYSSFVGSYKPLMEKKTDSEGRDIEELSYRFVPQVFTKAYIRAYRSLADDQLKELNKQDVYLVIEEINRGNCAQIFGDLFQLLDRGDDGYSEFPIAPDAELAKYLEDNGFSGSSIILPPNLHILATMNTSDQSLFPMDSAFKRRWQMEYVPIRLDNDVAIKYEIEAAGAKYKWVEFLREVNGRVRKATDSEDKQLGEFFVKGNKDNIIAEDVFVNKVMFYLWNDVCKDLYSTNRISQEYFMRSDEGNEAKDVFTFAELFGKGRFNEEDKSYTEPDALLKGFMEKCLKLKPITE